MGWILTIIALITILILPFIFVLLLICEIFWVPTVIFFRCLFTGNLRLELYRRKLKHGDKFLARTKVLNIYTVETNEVYLRKIYIKEVIKINTFYHGTIFYDDIIKPKNKKLFKLIYEEKNK